MTTQPPAELAHRCGPLVHDIPPGKCIGGPRVANALLLAFGERLAVELGLHERNPVPKPATPTRRPRR